MLVARRLVALRLVGPPAAPRLVAPLLGACVLLGSCATGPSGPSADASQTGPAVATSSGAPSSVTDDLRAEVVQYRRDAQRGVLQVKVTNHGAEPVRVSEVRLRTTTFTAPVTAEKDSTVTPGVAADLTVPLGPPACPSATGRAGGTGGSGGTGDHDVVLVVDGEAVRLPLEADVLEQVRGERCRVAGVTEHVDLAVAATWTEAGPVGGEPALRGAVVVTPRPGADRVGVAVEGATTLFTVAEPVSAELAAGAAEPVRLDVVLTVTRCDPHAVAEDKKGYLLPVRVAVAGAEPVLVEVAVPVPERGPLQDLVDRTCRG